MKALFRKFVALLLCVTILSPMTGGSAPRPRPVPPPAVTPPSLREHLQKSYLELFELAPKLDFSPAEIAAQRDLLKSGKDICIDRFENHSKQYAKQIDGARKELKKNTATLSEAERKQAHCSIQNFDLLKSEADVLA